MNDEKIIKIAAVGFIALVVAPLVINGAITVIGMTVEEISNLNQKRKFNKKIKKGLKDGSITEIDGKYYEVEITDPVEEA